MILQAARELFTEQGSAATTVAGVAAEAGVAVDTVYAAVGAKPVLFRLLLETAISGTDEAVPAEERDYVRRMKAQSRAREKIQTYAAAVTAIAQRLGLLHLVLRDAAAQAPELARIRNEIAVRRAKNMRLLAQDLMATGDLRPDLDPDQIADVVWSMNSAEFYSFSFTNVGGRQRSSSSGSPTRGAASFSASSPQQPTGTPVRRGRRQPAHRVRSAAREH